MALLHEPTEPPHRREEGVWGTLRALDGKSAPIRQDGKLHVCSKTFSRDKRKADAFM